MAWQTVLPRKRKRVPVAVVIAALAVLDAALLGVALPRPSADARSAVAIPMAECREEARVEGIVAVAPRFHESGEDGSPAWTWPATRATLVGAEGREWAESCVGARTADAPGDDALGPPEPHVLSVQAPLPSGEYALVVEAEGRPVVKREFTVRDGDPVVVGTWVP